jgi:hypothetical protein
VLAEQVYLLPTCVWKRAPGSHAHMPDVWCCPLSSDWIQIRPLVYIYFVQKCELVRGGVSY